MCVTAARLQCVSKRGGVTAAVSCRSMAHTSVHILSNQGNTQLQLQAPSAGQSASLPAGFLNPSYLLPKILSAVKDLEQPVGPSFSSSTRIGGGDKIAGRMEDEEEGREELEEEEAELKYSSQAWNNSSFSLSSILSGSAQAESPAPRPIRSWSGSMA